MSNFTGKPQEKKLLNDSTFLFSFDNIACLQKCPLLTEVTLDGNPFAVTPTYRQIMLHGIPSLKTLDSKRITVSSVFFYRKIENIYMEYLSAF